ncbi:BTB/POZ and MATH domain-containing protein 2-like [Triticum urartu]|nr:BTB/POZ and MATH domain-containing protein 2-like [Triticum urartu]
MSSFAGLTVVANGKRCSDWTPDTGATHGSGYHLLLIQDYSRTRREVTTGEHISSHPFTVGGHRWSVRYYPNGDKPDCADFVSLYVDLLDDTFEKPIEVQFNFSFVDPAAKHKKSANIGESGRSVPDVFSQVNSAWGWEKFIEKDAVERWAKHMGNCLAIRCDIVVVRDHAELVLPDIGQHLHQLLETELGADVRFEVGGELFAAHRYILAARSSVFRAQLFGPMKEGATTMPGAIVIEDMKANVYRAMLSFIYTDSLPTMEKAEEDEEGVMWLQDLLVAADRYDLQRLKFLCEEKLSEHIRVSTVASTLALAERHHCRMLKEACFQLLQVQTPSCLQEVMASSGWEHIVTAYPSVLNELIAKLISLNQK